MREITAISRAKSAVLLRREKVVFTRELSGGSVACFLQSSDIVILVPEKPFAILVPRKLGDVDLEAVISSSFALPIMLGRIESSESFLATYSDLSKLAAVTGIQLAALDKSLTSLRLLEQSVRRRYSYEERLLNDIFLPIVHYVGEVLIVALNGHWEFLDTNGLDVIEPVVCLPNGKQLFPFVNVYKELYSLPDDESSLFGVVHALVVISSPV